MSRIDATLAALKAQGRKALIPYVTAGFPFADVTPELMHAMVSAGADVIELGVPLLRPQRRRPGHPALRRQGAVHGYRYGAGAGDGAPI